MSKNGMYAGHAHSELTHQILRAAYEVHTTLGPGLLESAYETCLCYELSNRGLKVQRQVELPLGYKDLKLPGKEIGLLLNFNTISLKQGIKRLALTPLSPSFPLSGTLRPQR